jgi:uncharacterized protein (TIGR02145 family)
MSKVFNFKEEFINEIKSISIDGSFTLNLSQLNAYVPEAKQYPFVKAANNLSLEEGITNLPTNLRFELIRRGYEYLINELKFEELDAPDAPSPGHMTAHILINFPVFESKLNLSKLKGQWMAKAIISRPDIVDRVDLSNLTTYAWVILLAERPEFANQFDFSKLNTSDYAKFWFDILEKQPQFLKYCDVNILNDHQKGQLRWIQKSISDFLPSQIKTISDIKIGKQIWMNSNLQVTHFRNGDPIPVIGLDKEWHQAHKDKKPACCFYVNDDSNIQKFGLLYNWYAVIDKRGIAPEGYHIPTDKEWDVLIKFLENKTSPGLDLKSDGDEWNENGKGNNSSGFCALPGGIRYSGGFFHLIGERGFWWTSTPCEKGNLLQSCTAYDRSLQFYDNKINRAKAECGEGYSIRCLKDK